MKWGGIDDILTAGSSGEGLLGDDVIELLLRDKSVVIGIGSFDHLLQLGFINGLAQLLCDSSQILD